MDTFAVVADHQYQGRGTRGRSWIYGEKNLFLTVVIPVSSIPISLNLIPLRFLLYIFY
jgi:biotin-(acetyl-CoA carboxylase) ligase